jgi:two-component system, NtrC family, sensor kinase
MSISTRLIIILTIAVGLVMFVAGFLSLRQREIALGNAIEDELRAHAVTLKIALEETYTHQNPAETQNLINRLLDNSRIYAVLVFDENGKLLMLSQPTTTQTFLNPPELEKVLQTGEAVEFTREVNGQKFLSAILPVEMDNGRRGAVELVKPFTFVEAEITRARLDSIFTPWILLVTIFIVVTVVLRHNLSKPIYHLLEGAEAFGQGDLSHRVPVSKSKDELARLAIEFNRMADGIAEQKQQVQRETENRLALERELRHSERLASVGRLAAGIAHELGAPLNVIDARAEQLLSNPAAAPQKQVKNLTIIRTQTERITNIVRQLLNLARPYNLRLKTLDAGKLLKSTIEPFGDAAQQKGVEIEIQAAENSFVEADEEFLSQVFVNIVRNALQAMPQGGRLTVKTSRETVNENSYLQIEFSDTGGGVSLEHLPNIFEPFFTTKDIGQGTGLGLTVSRRIVEEHGGELRAENNKEGGATFIVLLPQTKEK